MPDAVVSVVFAFEYGVGPLRATTEGWFAVNGQKYVVAAVNDMGALFA